MQKRLRVRFGDFELDEEALLLSRRNTAIKIQRKPLEMLLYLVRHRDRVVTKAELLGAVWPDVTVSDQALASALRDLRRALDDTNSADRLITTTRGRGYRFIADVSDVGASETGPSRSPTPAPELDPLARAEPPFVDRDDVLRTLTASLIAASGGRTRISFIAGPAGIGKTRLTAELSRVAAERGIETQVGRCYDGDGATPFWPWLQIIRGCIARRNVDDLRLRLGRAFRQIAWIAPELEDPTEQEGRGDLARAEQRFRLFDAMGTFLRQVTETRPLLLILDDLHWGDEASLLLLEFVAQTLTDAKLHLVGAFRDAEVGADHTLNRVLGTSARQAVAERIELKGLCSESVAELLAQAAGRPPAPSFISAVANATGGNAFFVSEIAKLVSSGEFDVSGGGATIPVPARARDAVRLQVQRLSPECQRLVKIASVIGHEFDVAVLAQASGEESQAVLQRISEATRVGLVRATARRGFHTFEHDVVRESLYRDLPETERLRLHRRMAEALESVSSANPTQRLREIAYHYAEAAPDGVAARAVWFGLLAGDQANASMAFEDAVSLYGRGLAAMSLAPEADPRLRCELLLSQAEAAWGTQEDGASVQARFVDAANAAREAGSFEMLARAALGRTGYGAGLGDYRDITVIDTTDIELLDEARRALGADKTQLKALVMSRLALAVRYARGFAAADRLSLEAVALAKQQGDPETLAWVLRFRHEVISGPDFARERLQLADEVLRLARAAHSRPLELDALFFRARDTMELADPANSSEASTQARELSVTMKHPGAFFRSGIGEMNRLMRSGFLDQAQQRALEHLERDGVRNLSAAKTCMLQMLNIQMLRGEHDLAIEALTNASEMTTFPWLRFALARAHVLSGNLNQAREHFEWAATDGFSRLPDDHTRSGSLMHLAEVCADLKDVDRAALLYDLMLPYADMVALPFIGTVCQGAVARGLGVLATVLRRFGDAEAHFRAAVRIEESMTASALLALTLERFGAMWLARGRTGDKNRAREVLQRAKDLAERVGMRDVVRRTERATESIELSMN